MSIYGPFGVLHFLHWWMPNWDPLAGTRNSTSCIWPSVMPIPYNIYSSSLHLISHTYLFYLIPHVSKLLLIKVTRFINHSPCFIFPEQFTPWILIYDWSLSAMRLLLLIPVLKHETPYSSRPSQYWLLAWIDCIIDARPSYSRSFINIYVFANISFWEIPIL